MFSVLVNLLSMASSKVFDWSKCIFCQRDIRNSKINCPADSKRADVGSGYRSLCDAVNAFVALGKLLQIFRV